MKRLIKLLRRSQPAGTPVVQPQANKAPVPLSTDDLVKVSGGLPNVGGFATSATNVPPVKSD